MAAENENTIKDIADHICASLEENSATTPFHLASLYPTLYFRKEFDHL
jgi:hypothetical protein